MTLLVTLSGTNGIVAATDSRGTFGDPRTLTAQNDTQKKLYVLTKYSVILLAGVGELGSNVMAQVAASISKIEGVTPVTEHVRALVRRRYAEWFPSFAITAIPGVSAAVRPDLTLLVSGYEVDAHGQATNQRTYRLQSNFDFAPMLHNYGFSTAGVPQYALYLLNRLYRGDSTVEQLKSLSAYVITETASQDGKVGGPVQMAIMTPGEGCRELQRSEVDEVIAHNVRRSESLKASFYQE